MQLTFNPVILRHQNLLDGVPLPDANNLIEPQVGSKEGAKLLVSALGVSLGGFLQAWTWEPMDWFERLLGCTLMAVMLQSTSAGLYGLIRL